MKLVLLTVGKTDVPWVREGLQLYAARIQHYVRFEVKEIPELKNAGALSEEQIKAKEGALILKEAEGMDMILLDEHGREYRSLEFARELQNRLVHGGKDIRDRRERRHDEHDLSFLISDGLRHNDTFIILIHERRTLSQKAVYNIFGDTDLAFIDLIGITDDLEILVDHLDPAHEDPGDIIHDQVDFFAVFFTEAVILCQIIIE